MKQKQTVGIIVALVLIVLLVILFNTNACRSVPSPAPATAEAIASPPASPQAAEVRAAVLNEVNLRGGPGTNYAIVGSVPANSEVTVIGRNKDGTWLQVKSNVAEHVWVTADAALVKIEQAQLAGLPVVEAPTLPYDVNNPKVNDVLTLIPLVLHNSQSFTCASHAGINNLSALQEGNVIGPHAGDFVMGSDNVLFKYSGGSLVLIRENPIARFEGGAESLPFDKAMQMFQKGEIVWTGTLGQSPGRGVTGCDPAMK